MTFLKEIFNLKRASILLITLPFLAFNYQNIINSPFFSLKEIILLSIILFTVEILIKWIIFFFEKRKLNSLSIIVCCIEVIFFYGLYIVNYFQNYIDLNFNILIRGRTIFFLIIFISLILIYLFRKRIINYKFFNFFLILLSFVSLIISKLNYKNNSIENLKNSYTYFEKKNSKIKPIILIISDEYNSPVGLFKVNKDTTVFNLSNQLISNGWITKNNFFSYETSTIHSLSSLLNFNLSKNQQYRKETISYIGARKLIHSLFADSLRQKNIDIINFGIFHIGEHKYMTRLYMYPTSFIEEIMMNTIYFTVRENTGNFNKKGMGKYFYPMEKHNKYIFMYLKDSLDKLQNRNSFIYVHLYMPHSPFIFAPEFKYRELHNFKSYLDYWNFTNIKLKRLLLDLTKDNKYRIILTGDHGYRGDNRINPHFTFSAFYGFEKESIDSLKSVQDIGSLINSEY